MDDIGLVLKFKCGRRYCEESIIVSIDLSKISVIDGKIISDYYEVQNTLRNYKWKYNGGPQYEQYEERFALCPEHSK